MTPNNNHNTHRPKAPKERLNSHEKPLVQQYVHVTDTALGELFNRFSRMVQPRQFYNQVGAPAVEQAANEQVAYYPQATAAPTPVAAPQAGGVLDSDAIRQRIQREYADA